MLSAVLVCALLGGVSDEPYMAWVSEPVESTELPASKGNALLPNELAKIADGGNRPTPYADVTVGLGDPKGGLWIGSRHGLMYKAPGADRWQLFHSRRWLPDNYVKQLSLTEDGSVLVLTRAGIAKISQKPTTLDEKMARVDATLQAHHVREGLVGEINLNEPGKLDAGHVQHSSDNDGLWTSMYVGAEVLRYGATGAADAKANARKSLDALLRLGSVTDISGFVARSIVPIEIDAKMYGGKWYRAADGKVWWKGDTSSDELDGHYFAYALYYDIIADETEKAELREVVRKITDHIIDHGYYYVGPEGTPTTWGVWAPEKLNHDLEWLVDRGLNSLEMLSHLMVAEHMTGDAKYRRVADELIQKHAYATNTVLQKIVYPPNHVNHSDDELAFLAYYPLVWYERNPKLREYYMASLRLSWQVERPERSPLFNFIYAAGEQAERWSDPTKRPTEALVDGKTYDRDACIEWFRDVPEDTCDWRLENSDRRDVGSRRSNRFRGAVAEVVLPPSERRVMKWNGDPYELNGGGEGRSRDDGAFILLPYWMGRYHRFID